MRKKIFFVIKLAMKNLRKNSRKNMAAIISLAAGFMSINLFEGYMSGTQNIFREAFEERFMYGDYLIHHENAFKDSIFFDGESQITEADQVRVFTQLNSSKDVDISLKRLHFNGTITNGELTTQIIGEGVDVFTADKMRLPLWKWNASAGRPLHSGAGEILLGEELGRLLDCQLKDGTKNFRADGGYAQNEKGFDCPYKQLQLASTTETGSLNAIILEAVGVQNSMFREIDSRLVVVNLKDAQSLVNTTGISLISVKLRPQADHDRFIVQMRDFLKKNNLNLKVEPWKMSAFGEIYQQSMSFLNVLRVFFLTVILLIVLFSASATQTRLVFERIKETATLRSIGFSNKLITQIFLCESLLLASVGSIFGSLMSIILSVVIKKVGFFYLVGILSEEVPFFIEIVWWNFVKSGVVLVVISVIACVLPLRKALKISISEAFSLV